jgi:hypothetical protein
MLYGDSCRRSQQKSVPFFNAAANWKAAFADHGVTEMQAADGGRARSLKQGARTGERNIGIPNGHGHNS